MPDLKPHERSALKELKEELTRRHGSVELRLFGSKARGDSHSESDIDVLVILPESDWQTKHRVFRLCYEIGLARDLVFCPIVYARGRFNGELNRVTPFYENVEREGIKL